MCRLKTGILATGLMRPGKCPDDSSLEKYIYNDLTLAERFGVRVHLTMCSRCRERLDYLRWFSSVLSSVPREEPPLEFTEKLLEAVNTWQPPSCGVAEKVDPYQAPVTPGPALRLTPRLALGTFIVLAIGLLQGNLGGGVLGVIGEGRLTWVEGVLSIWGFFLSGELQTCTRAVLSALRLDTLASIIILGGVLPSAALSVIVFVGIAAAVLITQFQRRSGGKAYEETL